MDSDTLYVANEGDGYAGGLDLHSHAAGQTTAGLQKWVFNSGSWQYAYTLQKGLWLGTAYAPDGYPTNLNPATCIVAKGQPNPNNCTRANLGQAKHDRQPLLWLEGILHPAASESRASPEVLCKHEVVN